MHHRNPRASVAALAALAVLATGCGSDAEPESSPSSEDAEASTPTTDASGDEDGDADASAAGAPEVDLVDPGERDPIAAARGQGEYHEVRVLDLRRSRDQVILDLEIVLGEEGGPEVEPRVFFDTKVDGRAEAMSGVRLVDWDNGNRHYALSDVENRCVCSVWSVTRVAGGDAVVHSVHFPAPPDDVTHLAVEVPRFPLIDDVPIRSGS